jgi:hypothetical protein
MPTSQKIHYQPPLKAHSRMRCYYGDESRKTTTDPNQVTCVNCLRRIKNETVGRPKKPEGETVKTTAFCLSPQAWEKVQSIPKKERSAWINQLILNN